MTIRSASLCALTLSLSVLGFSSVASAQSGDSFDRMRAGYNASTGRAANAPAPAGMRVAAELLGGAVGGFAVGGAGLLGGGLACGFDALDSLSTINGSTSSACHGRLPPAMFGPAFLGASVGGALGVTLTGDRMGGRGTWWGSTLGMLAGSAVGLAVVSQSDLDWRMSSLVFVGATTLGSTVGYELSAAFADTAPPAIAGRRVSPVAVATPGGAQFGLVGSF